MIGHLDHDRSNQVLSMMKTIQDNYVTNHIDIDMVYAENEIELSWPIEHRPHMKARHDNDMIDDIELVYAKIEIQLMRPI